MDHNLPNHRQGKVTGKRIIVRLSVKELSHTPVPSLDQNFPFRPSFGHFVLRPLDFLTILNKCQTLPKPPSSSLSTPRFRDWSSNWYFLSWKLSFVNHLSSIFTQKQSLFQPLPCALILIARILTTLKYTGAYSQGFSPLQFLLLSRTTMNLDELVNNSASHSVTLMNDLILYHSLTTHHRTIPGLCHHVTIHGWKLTFGNYFLSTVF